KLCQRPRFFIILSEGEGPNRRTPKKSANACSFKVFSRLSVTQELCHPERSRAESRGNGFSRKVPFHEKSSDEQMTTIGNLLLNNKNSVIPSAVRPAASVVSRKGSTQPRDLGFFMTLKGGRTSTRVAKLSPSKNTKPLLMPPPAPPPLRSLSIAGGAEGNSAQPT